MSANLSIASNASVAPSEARPRILIADDSRVIRLAIKKILGTQYDIVQVEDGANAWDCIREDREIQALVTDIEMPQMDGYELIRHIRAADDSRIRDLPVIAITGTDDEYVRQRALECGATDFITKPLDSIQLQARVKAYARYEEATRALHQRARSLEDQAIDDPLTGLRSRRYLIQRGEQDVGYSLRRGRDLTVIRIDIDGFKKIYCERGDEVSDRLLAWVANLLFTNARIEDTVARISGAEFAIMATATGCQDAVALCERVREAIAYQPFSFGHTTVPITLSMGLASIKADRRDTIESLLKLANERLCQARNEGGNRICAAVLSETVAAEDQVTVRDADNSGAPEPEPATSLTPLATSRDPELPETTPLREITGSVEPPGAIAAGVTGRAAANVPSMGIIDLISVDRALALLAAGKGSLLGPYLDILVQRVDPLLEFYHSRRFGSTGD